MIKSYFELLFSTFVNSNFEIPFKRSIPITKSGEKSKVILKTSNIISEYE